MSNLSMITDLLGHAYHLEDNSPDEQHLKVKELIDKLVERDRVLVEALENILDYDDPCGSGHAGWIAQNALRAVGEDV